MDIDPVHAVQDAADQEEDEILAPDQVEDEEGEEIDEDDDDDDDGENEQADLAVYDAGIADPVEPGRERTGSAEPAAIVSLCAVVFYKMLEMCILIDFRRCFDV